MDVIERLSPNHGERRAGAVDMLVIHYTGMATAEEALQWLADERSRVSAHYLVDEAGAVYALVPEDRRAWHAGESMWAGEGDVNSRSVGIEVHNPGHDGALPDYPDTQIEAVIALALEIVERHGIAPARVLAHSDVAPARKRDPGERFPWARLAKAGVGLWAEAGEPDERAVLAAGERGDAVAALQHDLAALGYAIEMTREFDAATEAVVAAFQRHWRPALVDGRADGSTRDQLAQLLRMAAGE